MITVMPRSRNFGPGSDGDEIGRAFEIDVLQLLVHQGDVPSSGSKRGEVGKRQGNEGAHLGFENRAVGFGYVVRGLNN